MLDNITSPAAIIACPGIGARFLGGIEDRDVYPVRGQTILLRAPWVEYGRTLSGPDGLYIYMMPRCTGDVRLCFFCSAERGNAQHLPNRWSLVGLKCPMTGKCFLSKSQIPVSLTEYIDTRYPKPRATDRTYVLTRILALCPDLAPPSVRASREPTVGDLEALIVDEGCGLRPARMGGIRLEVGSLERGEGEKIPVVYNYG